MGSSKMRVAARRRAAMVGGSALRFCYRIIYVVLVLAAGAVVVKRLRGARMSSLASSDAGAYGETSKKFKNEGEIGNVSLEVEVPGPVLDLKHEHQREWIEKPNSLCYGRGNVTVFTVTIGLPQAYLVFLRSNRLAYTNTHGYRYCEVSTLLDFSRPPPWTKVKATYLVLSFADVVIHVDADALIVNRTVSVESILSIAALNSSDREVDAIYTNDYKQGRDSEPDAKLPVSSAVYIMRSTPWTKAFLEAQDKFYRESLFNKFEEQDAVNLYKMKHADDFIQHIVILPFWVMNSACSIQYNHYKPGDFIAHFVGGHTPDKYERLVSMLLSKDSHNRNCSTCKCFIQSGNIKSLHT